MKELNQLFAESKKVAPTIRVLTNADCQRILKYLATVKSSSVFGIWTKLHLYQSATSTHLKKLYKAGLVTKETDGSVRRYSINQDAMEKVYEQIEAVNKLST